ncbi:MAG: tripartite tricarboxylate transporter substrate binding protein [Burkholderiaceae bacterium]
MTASRRRLLRQAIAVAGASAAGSLFTVPSARAQAAAWPSRPLRLIVPFPPGGATDNVARVLVKALSQSLGQQVVIDNRAGANGRLGTELAAQAAADGQTLLFGGIGPLTIAPHLDKVPYDPARDFTPVSCVVFYDSVLVANPSLPADDIRGLIAYLKRPDTRANYASSGSGGPYHMGFELFKALAGVEINHVPYKGDGPAIIDLAAGNVQCMITSTSAAMPQIRAGRIKVLASAGSRRAALFPEIGTIAEQGVPGYSLDAWGGLIGPAGLAPAIVTTLYEAVRQAATDPALAEGFAAQGGAFIGNRPDEFAAFLASEFRKWGQLIRERRLNV